MKSRKQRKLEAKLNGEKFTPKYNGNEVVSFEDYHGVGNERFDNKFVQFLKPSDTPNELSEGIVIEDAPAEDTVEPLTIDIVEVESVEDAPKRKIGKFKQKLSKLFGK